MEAGLVERLLYQTRPIRCDYLPTEKGRSLRPVIVALAGWGNARLAPEQRSMILVNAETGVEVEPIVVDRSTGRPLDGPEFTFTAGPAAGNAKRASYETGQSKRG